MSDEIKSLEYPEDARCRRCDQSFWSWQRGAGMTSTGCNDDNGVFSLHAWHSQTMSLQKLVQEELDSHSDPESPFYNDCHPGQECSWCETALKVTGQTKEGE